MHRIVIKFAWQRKVEVVFHRRGVKRLQVDVQGICEFAVEHRDCADRHLQQDIQLLRRRRWVGHDHLASIDGLHQKLIGDVLVELLVVDIAVAITVAEKILTHQNWHLAVDNLGPSNLFMKGDHCMLGHQAHPLLFDLDLMVTRPKWQIEQGERQHHLRKIARGFGKMRGQKRLLWIAQDKIPPEPIHLNQIGILLFERQMVVVIFGPFLCLIDLLVELTVDQTPQAIRAKKRVSIGIILLLA